MNIIQSLREGRLFRSLTPENIPPGTVINPYRIIRRISHGGYGVVYQAEHLYSPNKIVAIKFLRSKYLNNTLELDRFYQEARILDTLTPHPHIVHYLDYGVYKKLPYMILKYAPHGTLRDLIEMYPSGKIPMNTAITLISQIGEGLCATHELGIVHGDLRPPNILLNINNEPMLADFGIAQELGKNMDSLVGYRPYMAPEQAAGGFSAKSDQYSLACMAVKLLTGRIPFVSQTRRAGKSQLQFDPTVPPHVKQAILKALAQDLTDRHGNIRAFITALTTPSYQGYGNYARPIQARRRQYRGNSQIRRKF